MAEICSNPTCSEPGTRKCSRCKSRKYCSPDCQKADWVAHKEACRAATQSNIPKANCYILHAAPRTPNAPVLDNIARQIEPFHLSDLGNEVAEKRQLESHLGWKGSFEVGKFYDHRGSDTWYYYVYGDARAFDANSGLPANEAAGLICHKRKVYGDIGIVRSGPVGSSLAEEFSKTELVKAVEFYRTNDKDKVFRERDESGHGDFWGGLGLRMCISMSDEDVCSFICLDCFVRLLCQAAAMILAWYGVRVRVKDAFGGGAATVGANSLLSPVISL